jgi:FkbM family methyltransferase
MSLSQTARRTLLPVFQRANIGNITISHHWTGDALTLHSFKHKGYWWYGKHRERDTMELFAKLVPRDSTIIEIGAHIGYVAQYLSMLTGPHGKLYCFEPSPENLPYLRVNASQSSRENIFIVEAAAGDRDGTAPFFYETITGQNSTVASDFSGFEVNTRFNGLSAEYQTCTVPMRRLDSFLAEHSIHPGFIKIDAEGGELSILSGMPETLSHGPRLMVEINTHHAEVFDLLTQAHYTLFNDSRHRLTTASPDSFDGNIFAIHAADPEGHTILNTPK